MSIKKNDVQEAGRAARDGSIGRAILLWSPVDSKKFGAFEPGSRGRVMKTFAESRTCRREVLLDALGGEKTVCDGCDICDHGGLPADCSKVFPWGTPQDAAVVLDFVYRHRKLFRREELIGELVALFNRRDAPVFGMCVWEHGDVEQILDLLEQESLVRTCLWPWFGRIDCGLKRRGLIPKICRGKKWRSMQDFQTRLSLWPAVFKKKLFSVMKKRVQKSGLRHENYR